jgi:hypothetical protein
MRRETRRGVEKVADNFRGLHIDGAFDTICARPLVTTTEIMIVLWTEQTFDEEAKTMRTRMKGIKRC